MSDFYDVDPEVLAMFDEIRREHFPGMVNAKFKLIFSEKKSTSQGMVVVAKTKKATGMEKFLSRREADTDEGFDYIITIDNNIWDELEDADRVRILRHELRHCWYDSDSNTSPYKVIGHEVNDFYDEITLNADDPRWMERIHEIVSSVYDRSN